MKCYLVTGFAIFEVLVLLILIVIASRSLSQYEQEINMKTGIAAPLMLTDLALWPEARFTRHSSQADYFAAFQTGPGYFDHFPAGSFMPPPGMELTQDSQTGGEQ